MITGRMKPGIPAERAIPAVDAVASRYNAEHPESRSELRLGAVPLGSILLHPDLDKTIGAMAALLFVAVGMVLLIACVNLAGFLLARSTDRRKEMAVRVAMGAGAGAIARQLLVEAAVLAGLGGAARPGAGPALPADAPLDRLPGPDADPARRGAERAPPPLHRGRLGARGARVRPHPRAQRHPRTGGRPRCATSRARAAAAGRRGPASSWSPPRWRCARCCSSARASSCAACAAPRTRTWASPPRRPPWSRRRRGRTSTRTPSSARSWTTSCARSLRSRAWTPSPRRVVSLSTWDRRTPRSTSRASTRRRTPTTIPSSRRA